MEEESIFSEEAQSQPIREIFTEGEIKSYQEGCQLIGLTLNETIGRIRKDGKKPTILIPSRGAVPVFLLALDYINTSEEDKTLLDSTRTRYYPFGIFKHLSAGVIQESRPQNESQVDVVIYPFTADVSPQAKDGEKLAAKLRQSCARASADLLYGTKSSLDLGWYLFLLGKLKETVYQDFGSSPGMVVDSLRSIPKDQTREIILLDTVISGRAAANITHAFSDEGHPVVPILAVDSSRGSKFQPHFKAEVESKSNFNYLENIEDQYIDFPLLSEDKGAVLLGVAAVNFANFNEDFYFHKHDERFPKDFFPQSCLWIIPPRNYYLSLFHAFMERCQKGIPSDDPEAFIRWYLASQQLREILKKRTAPGEREISSFLGAKNLAITETASHIVSLKLDPQEASNWVKEFAARSLNP